MVTKTTYIYSYLFFNIADAVAHILEWSLRSVVLVLYLVLDNCCLVYCHCYSYSYYVLDVAQLFLSFVCAGSAAPY